MKDIPEHFFVFVAVLLPPPRLYPKRNNHRCFFLISISHTIPTSRLLKGLECLGLSHCPAPAVVLCLAIHPFRYGGRCGGFNTGRLEWLLWCLVYLQLCHGVIDVSFVTSGLYWSRDTSYLNFLVRVELIFPELLIPGVGAYRVISDE